MTDQLADVLGAPPPASVAALSDVVLDRLAAQVVRARSNQKALGDEAVETALKGVPLPVRGIVKKALGA